MAMWGLCEVQVSGKKLNQLCAFGLPIMNSRKGKWNGLMRLNFVIMCVIVWHRPIKILFNYGFGIGAERACAFRWIRETIPTPTDLSADKQERSGGRWGCFGFPCEITKLLYYVRERNALSLTTLGCCEREILINF